MANRILRRAAVATVVALGGLLIALYVGDFAVLRLRMARGGADSVLSTVTVLYGAPQKDGRVELFTDQPQQQTCVQSIFPELGYTPCWYARRHAVQVVN